MCTPIQADIELPEVGNRETAGVDGTGIYLDDSLEGADALIRVEGLVKADRWREAAELLQRTSDQHGDKLYRVSSGYYIGLRNYINELIADWPPAGLEAYRSMFEHELDRALAELRQGGSERTSFVATNLNKKLDLFHRYFCTRAAIPLADAIGQAAIETGDFALAESVWNKTLERHPDVGDRADYFRAMLAIARALRSATTNNQQADTGLLPEIAPRQKIEQVDAKVRWKGQDRSLAEILADIRDHFSAPPRASEEDEWPTHRGAYTRNRITPCTVDDLGVQWRFSFRVERQKDNDDDEMILTESDRDRARDYAVHPVVAGGIVFVQRYREIIALRQTTGEPVWRFRADSVEREPPSFIHEQPPRWDTPTVADGRIYAAFSGPPSSYHGYGSSQSGHELVCLEAQTGTLIWRVSERAFAARFAEVRFDPSPIVDHDRLYIVGRRRRSFGFEDAYLFRFDARTGRFISQTHIGSASTGTYGTQSATKSVAALHGDTIYVASNLGSVAAVSAYTGAIRWLRLYERTTSGSGRMSGRSSDVAPWHFNAVILANAGLIVQPMDSPNILILSPTDGRQLKSIPIGVATRPADREDDAPFEPPLIKSSGPVTLLGIRDALLCFIADEVGCLDINTEKTIWSRGIGEDARLFGRAAWAGDRILVSTTKGLSAFHIEDGARSDLPWPPAGTPGNLLALMDQLIVTGPEIVTSYVRKSDMWNRLRERLAAAPSDPIPALELAEVAMRSGETLEAVDGLELAVSRLKETVDDRVRSRLFKNAVSFAEDMTSLSTPEDAAILTRLYDVAARFPTDREDHLNYRLKFAALFQRTGDPARALALYQQVLQDRSLRELPVTGHGASAAAAAHFCRDRIAVLIEQHGPSLYESYEKEAERLLQAGRAASDEATINRVIHAFPNSRVAPQALITLGEMLGRSGRTQEAVRLLIHAYHRYPDAAASGRWASVDRADLIKRIAETFKWGGRREDAYRWLTKGALEYPGVLIDDGERRLTFLQYRERLADVREQVEPTRPAIALPLDRRFTREFEGPTALLIPRFAHDPFTRWSRAYVYSDRKIHALHPTSGADTWDQPSTSRESVDLLLSRENVAVFATSYEIFGLDPKSGRRLWSHGEYPRALDDPLADWEHGEIVRTHALHGDILVSVRDSGAITAIDVRSGKLMWSATHQPTPAGPIAVNEDLLIYHVMQDGHAILCLVNPTTGQWIDSVATGEGRPVDDLLLTLDGQVLLVTSQSIAAIDPQTGAARWRVTTPGHFRRESILLDVDAVYFSPDGRDLRKISLDDGRVIWQIIGLMGSGDDDITIDRHDAQLIVSTTRSVLAVDAVTGMNLWRGTTPRDPNFRLRALTRKHAMAIDLPLGRAEQEGQAFFYDLRNASGVIPENGAPQLGDMDDVRRILPADRAILIQSGPTTVLGVSATQEQGAPP